MFRLSRTSHRSSSHLVSFHEQLVQLLNPGSRRSISFSVSASQARQRIRPAPKTPPLRRPCLDQDNPFLSTSSLIGTQWRPPVPAHESWRYPIAVPQTALDEELIRKLKPSASPSNEHQFLDPESVLEVRQDGQEQVKKITENWVRNELNVMGTIREETVQIFLKLLLHPSTLAPLAQRLKLRTAGRRRPAKASLHPPARLVPASTHADIELSQLFYYLIGTIYRSLSTPGTERSPPARLERYVVNLLKHGLPHTSARQLLIRASELSGQTMIGLKKGHARAEIRVAQLSIWGERRAKKLRKLVPDQKCHRTPLRMRKAVLLKQRWRDEEEKMVHWRRRLLNVTAVQEAERLAEKQYREDYNLQLKRWRQTQEEERKHLIKPESTLFSRLMSFWRTTAPAKP